jgi:hypothetical protein
MQIGKRPVRFLCLACLLPGFLRPLWARAESLSPSLQIGQDLIPSCSGSGLNIFYSKGLYCSGKIPQPLIGFTKILPQLARRQTRLRPSQAIHPLAALVELPRQLIPTAGHKPEMVSERNGPIPSLHVQPFFQFRVDRPSDGGQLLQHCTFIF